MGLHPIRTGLRTIHNGSHSVAKAQINVPAGGDLTVPEVVADQLQRDCAAFKDGAAPDSLLEALAPRPDPAVEAEKLADMEAEMDRLKAEEAAQKAAPVKKVAAKATKEK